MLEIMRQGILIGRYIVFVAIPGRIEIEARPPAFALAECGVVQQRLDIQGLHFRVASKIPRRVEDRVRLAAFEIAIQKEVLERINVRLANIRIRRDVVVLVKQAE
jgi:hypothetical protein